MDFFIKAFGFSDYDVLLLLFCPMFAAIGGIVNIFMLWADYSKIPDEGSFTFASCKLAFFRIAWLPIRILLSCIAGLVFGLCLVGALNHTPATTARILVLSILIGYAAPKLWITQEVVFTEAFEKSLKKALREHEKESAAQAAQLKEE